MKTFAALIRRYVLATAAIVLLVGGLLVGQIFYVGFKSNAVDATGYRVGALADALKQTKTGLQWGREHTPAEWMQGYAWAMVLDEDGNLQRKADMFTKRTIQPHRAVTHVDTASEALAVSISEKARVDMPYMAQLTGKTEAELAAELRGVIFRVPNETDGADGPQYAAADEYLSGNVRQKLRTAQRVAARDPFFAGNVDALIAAQPKDLEASEIEVRLGVTWLDKKYIEQFMYETFETPRYLRGQIEISYVPYTAEWQVSRKSMVRYNDVAAFTTYGTDRASAYRLLEDALNLRDIRIYDTIEDADGRERRVLNAKETTLAAQKQQLIRDAFKDWIWKDPERRETLVRQYNEEMNSTRPREYDGSHIVFSGMNPEITLREHQKNAIAHVLYGGNTLLAHEVGAGKTFEMVASAMESKRLGLCQKSIFVVPNHLTEQWASEFLRLYPSANILVTTKKDFETHNRKKFCARIATGDYDAVIIGHSQFERIPISPERQEQLLHQQIEEITDGIQDTKLAGGNSFTIKSLERTKKGLEARLKKLQASDRKDDVIYFEQLGVDRMFVDESDNYKNLFLYTKMRNVAGLSTTDAQKSSDMFSKCRYMDELTGGRGVVFATGTPVSNSMTELYTIQRYLQHDRLQEMGMGHFDCWASRFGETTTALEHRLPGKDALCKVFQLARIDEPVQRGRRHQNGGSAPLAHAGGCVPHHRHQTHADPAGHGESPLGTSVQGTQRCGQPGCGQYAQNYLGRTQAGA